MRFTNHEKIYNKYRGYTNYLILVPLIAPTVSANTISRTYAIPAQSNSGSSHMSVAKIGDLSVTGNPKVEITFTYPAGVKEVRVYLNDLANAGPVDITKILTFETVPTNKKITLDFGNTAVWSVLAKSKGTVVLRVEYTTNAVRFYGINFENSQLPPISYTTPGVVQPTPLPPSVLLPGGPSTDLPSNSRKVSSIPAKFSGTYTAKLPLAYGTGTVKIEAGNKITFTDVYVNVGHLQGFSDPQSFYDKTTIYKTTAKTDRSFFSLSNGITISSIYEKPDGGVKIKANVIVYNRLLS
jgi:hypothetical protein